MTSQVPVATLPGLACATSTPGHTAASDLPGVTAPPARATHKTRFCAMRALARPCRALATRWARGNARPGALWVGGATSDWGDAPNARADRWSAAMVPPTPNIRRMDERMQCGVVAAAGSAVLSGQVPAEPHGGMAGTPGNGYGHWHQSSASSRVQQSGLHCNLSVKLVGNFACGVVDACCDHWQKSRAAPGRRERPCSVLAALCSASRRFPGTP